MVGIPYLLQPAQYVSFREKFYDCAAIGIRIGTKLLSERKEIRNLNKQ